MKDKKQEIIKEWKEFVSSNTTFGFIEGDDYAEDISPFFFGSNYEVKEFWKESNKILLKALNYEKD